MCISLSIADYEPGRHCYCNGTKVGERLQECNGDEILKSEAAAKVQRFTEWALKCIGSHSRGKAAHPGSPGDISMAIIHSSAVESRLQLLAFKRFLELAGSRLTKRDYTEAFDAACFPLTVFQRYRSGMGNWHSSKCNAGPAGTSS